MKLLRDHYYITFASTFVAKAGETIKNYTVLPYLLLSQSSDVNLVEQNE